LGTPFFRSLQFRRGATSILLYPPLSSSTLLYAPLPSSTLLYPPLSSSTLLYPGDVFLDNAEFWDLYGYFSTNIESALRCVHVDTHGGRRRDT